MRFRTGVIVGLAVGYYYGAKAGRERYLQIDHYLAQVRASDAYQGVWGQLEGLLDDSLVGRAREMMNDATGNSATPYDYTGDPTLN